MSKFYFVIDTDKYSGNFEREMCAYITGQYGECGVGSEIANKVKNELGKLYNTFQDIVEHSTDSDDDYPCFRPCKIYPTPGYYNNGLGFEFKDGEEELAKQKYLEFADKNPQYDLSDSVQEMSKKGVAKFPAYMSVAIFFNKKPSDKIIKVMKDRAIKFAELCSKNKSEEIGTRYSLNAMNITGFRLIKEQTRTTEESV